MQRYRVEIDLPALDDLTALREYITASRGSRVASDFIDRILKYIDGFETAPARGAAHDHIRPGARTVGWRKTVTVVFRVDGDAGKVVVLAVVYRGRDVAKIVRDRT